MKDAARLLAYFAGTLIFAALLAPVLYWIAQSLAAHNILPRLAGYDFQTFFHRALLICALALLWPLLRSFHLSFRELQLQPNRSWLRDIAFGFGFAALLLLLCGGALIALAIYSLRHNAQWSGLIGIAAATLIVPIIEEAFFRGFLLGVILHRNSKTVAIFCSSALYSVLHFLKAPDNATDAVNWSSGFRSIANSFGQFAEPMLLLSGFTTLFLIGWILADTRLRTKSLALPIGLHAGWIFANGLFNRVARRELTALPWIGKDLSIGLVPLVVALVTWALVILWLRNRTPATSHNESA